MCGRYASARKREQLLQEFEIGYDGTSEELAADYNVAPTKKVYAVLTRPREEDKDKKDKKAGSASTESSTSAKDAKAEPTRQLRVLKWGLVPSWAKDPSVGSRMINARVETLAEKPSYRRAFTQRRCLLPADGYYEWYKIDKKNKQPYFIHPADGAVMAMAGLYEFWKDPGRADDDPDKWLVTCTVITTTAEDSLGRIHDRMPMIITPDKWADWLDPGLTDVDQVRSLLDSSAPHGLAAYPVSTDVNNVRNNGPHLLKPEESEEELFRVTGG